MNHRVFAALMYTPILMGTAQAAPAREESNIEYHFSLVKSHDDAVCSAYLARLNGIDYEREPEQEPPYCDRPEDTSVPGFSKLARAPLSMPERKALFREIYNFSHQPFQLSNKESQELLSGIPISGPIWLYNPGIDIDNDGTTDNVLIWRGWGAEAGTQWCGNRYEASDGLPWRASQQAYVLTADGSHIDATRTKAIFAKELEPAPFNPIGQSIGIFRFQGKYYFDAFQFGPNSYDAGMSDPRIADILEVFIHENGATRNVCEYRMRDPYIAPKSHRSKRTRP